MVDALPLFPHLVDDDLRDLAVLFLPSADAILVVQTGLFYFVDQVLRHHHVLAFGLKDEQEDLECAVGDLEVGVDDLEVVGFVELVVLEHECDDPLDMRRDGVVDVLEVNPVRFVLRQPRRRPLSKLLQDRRWM